MNRIRFFISISFYIQCVFAQDTNCVKLNLDSTNCYILKKFNKPNIFLEKKWESDVKVLTDQSAIIVDVDNDCIPEIITFSENLSFTTNEIVILDSRTGAIKNKFITLKQASDDNPNVLVADVNNDGLKEILLCTDNSINVFPNHSKIVCYNIIGQLLWISNERYHNVAIGNQNPTLGITDFNQDGLPELYVYNQVFNAQTGVLLVDGDDKDGIGGSDLTMLVSHQVSVAAQLDQDQSDLELAAGFSIYKIKLTNLNNKVGNTITPLNIQVNGQYLDGRTSVADINKDGQLDVIVAHSNEFGSHILYVYSIINNILTLLASYNNYTNLNHIGTPTIADIDGDGNPNILLSKYDAIDCYEYNNNVALDLKWSIKIDDANSYSGVSAFDFNGDRVPELMHRGDSLLYIIDGSTNPPTIIDSKTCFSFTTNENCTIADIDNSGSSKICITCNPEITRYSIISKLTVFGGPDGQEWAPARPIWNQYAYNPLYINDDLTVPQYPKNQATYMNGKYNNFMQQESLLDSNGMYKVAAASLWGRMNCMNYDPVKDEFVLNFDLHNKKDASRSTGDHWYVTFYNDDPENGGIVIDSILVIKDLKPGDTLRDQVFTIKRSGIKQLFMVVNTSRSGGGIFDDKDFKVLECDYKDNISQWIDFPVVTEIKDVFCESKGYKYKDSTYTMTGKYYNIVRNSLGCDQEVTILDLEARDSVLQDLYYSSCDSIRLVDTTFYSTGIKTYQYNTSYGCDSTIIAHVEIRNSSVNNTSATQCDSINWNGRIIKQSGKYSYQSSNVNGCDSTTNLTLTIHNSKIIDQYKSSCNSFTWNGNTYNQSGDYTHQSSTINGCDSTTILHLTIDTLVRESINIKECQSYNWNGRIITSTGIYLDTFRTINGCDSIVTLDLNIANNRSSSSQTSCDQYTWNNKLLTQSGIYYDTLKNNQGCDSIAQLYLTVNNSNTNLLVINSCNNYNWKNQNLTQSGIYRDTTSTSLGCDSISILNLAIRQAFDTSITIKSCESYTWNGQTITQSGQYQYKGLTQHNCDSAIQLNLTINKNSSSNLNLSVCDSVNILGNTYNKAGAYTINTINKDGCDSTIILTLTILAQKIIENKSSCDSFLWNNQIYTQSGIYSNKNTNINGCDSTHQLNLTIHPSFKDNINAQDCKEYYWPSDNTIYKQSGIYQARYTTSQGCDSTLTLNLTIHPDFEKSDSITTNTTYQWPINQKSYNQSGTYQESYTDINGCDSIYKLLLIIIDDDIEIYAPNVFNPNSSINNKFTLYDNGTRAIINTLSIYDRWGGLLWQKQNFPTNNPNDGWDGTSHKVKLNPGVYVWYAEVITAKGRKIVLKGDVTIIQ